jgi:hypothetical protein
MDFSKLKLTEGVSTSSNLAIDAEKKTTDYATNLSSPEQKNPARKEMQMKQRTAKFGTPTTKQQIGDSYDMLRQHKELLKMREAAMTDWRKELMEAANPDDDPDHPFVEVMPHYQYRQKEAMENLKKAQMKDKASGIKNPAVSGVNENASPGDYQDAPGKKTSGKIVGKGPGTDNHDRTATPKENVARRKVNANPSMRADMGKKFVDRVSSKS